MKIEEIKKMPRVLNNIHESSFMSYHVLDVVLKMIDRGDSKETIFEIVEFLKDIKNEL